MIEEISSLILVKTCLKQAIHYDLQQIRTLSSLILQRSIIRRRIGELFSLKV